MSSQTWLVSRQYFCLTLWSSACVRALAPPNLQRPDFSPPSCSSLTLSVTIDVLYTSAKCKTDAVGTQTVRQLAARDDPCSADVGRLHGSNRPETVASKPTVASHQLVFPCSLYKPKPDGCMSSRFRVPSLLWRLETCSKLPLNRNPSQDRQVIGLAAFSSEPHEITCTRGCT